MCPKEDECDEFNSHAKACNRETRFLEKRIALALLAGALTGAGIYGGRKVGQFINERNMQREFGFNDIPRDFGYESYRTDDSNIYTV